MSVSHRVKFMTFVGCFLLSSIQDGNGTVEAWNQPKNQFHDNHRRAGASSSSSSSSSFGKSFHYHDIHGSDDRDRCLRVSSRNDDIKNGLIQSTSTMNRRQWWEASVSRITSTMVMATTTATASSALTSLPANAACLPGDLSKDCIGVYKVPIDDRILPYVSSPEALKRFAPDLTYVPPIPVPDSIDQAWEILETQRLAANDIQDVVQAGRLEEAGIKILNLVPKLTSSGKVVLDDALYQIAKKNTSPKANGMNDDDINNNNNINETISSSARSIGDLASSRLETQWDMALGLWGEADIMMGQGLRGDLGASVVAQIQILTQLKDATAAFDDFLASAASASDRKRMP